MIVAEARRLVAEQGTTGLTFQALASTLGVSKQAIIYWYPSKRELARDFCLPLLREERDVVTTAIADTRSATEAIEAFVRSLVRYHLSDLGRFRILYLWLQFEPGVSLRPGDEQLLDPIHETTSSSYDLLEARIAADRAFLGNGDARKLAVAVDMAALGLVTMLAMAEAMNDPWRHSTESMVDALIDLLTGQHRSDAAKRI
ncbi:TetR/AcrR family transcriptional regulator [Mesorhizobium sp. YIM 152430]|uniref:TetR/AcrR family transcriptional regulator n=1 Tax=Mesorhizobium sp. YIM 152430 TaxID=3031761 RepID=UPI0023DAC203|nr:TetR/AcrR family transcriptional regulator [Mesorhizobium sp. YIM 152430]MDF1601900.1 TetR/AcrR family transcriptional regulator [Mesorhizobium sp. YIM 152430]